MNSKTAIPESVRLPLQLGTSALWNLARVCAALIPGVLLTVSASMGSIGWVLGALGVYLIIYALLQILPGLRARPSDAILGSRTLRIDGGIHSGLELPWEEIDGENTGSELVEERRLTVIYLWEDVLKLGLAAGGARLGIELRPQLKAIQRIPIRHLIVQTRDGARIHLASAEAPEEQASLEAIHGSIQSRLGEAPTADVPDSEIHIHRCSQCSVALAPSGDTSTHCHHCGSENPVPPALQERARAHEQIQASRQSSGQLVSRLLEQPGAIWANRVLLLLVLCCLLVWVVLIFVLQIASFSNMGVFELCWSLIAGSGLVLAFFTWSRSALVKRRALHLLCSHFGARRSSQGEAPCCRNCGGPLPETDGALVICLFCDTDNVLGIDLRPFQKPLEQQAQALSEALQAREREARRWRASSVSVLLAAGFGAIMVLMQFVVASEFADKLARCEGGEAEACYSVGVDYDLGISVTEDELEALHYYLLACEQDHAEACYSASFSYWTEPPPLYDPDRGEQLRNRSCRLGYAEACED